ncbi:MAG: tRNA (guanosine(46)-N7)-methyltransferase TrmB [Eubacteriales bacterium]|nr:tRNA (guanosine(46)-N7)-methyltransferase TrmB [Eubacteriales bacterium]
MRIRHIKGAEEMVAAHPLVINEPETMKGKWPHPLYVEIGTGMGTFIRESAINNPDIFYLGLEMNSTVLYKCLKRYEKLEADGRNIRLIRCDARMVCDYFEKGEVDRIYLNFSDPWPKDKNANKRLTSPMFLRRYEEILKPGGVIEFKTDNSLLFDYSVETAKEEGWTFDALTYDLHNDPVMNVGNIMTEYEAKFSAKGNKIGKMIIHK